MRVTESELKRSGSRDCNPNSYFVGGSERTYILYCIEIKKIDYKSIYLVSKYIIECHTVFPISKFRAWLLEWFFFDSK